MQENYLNTYLEYNYGHICKHTPKNTPTMFYLRSTQEHAEHFSGWITVEVKMVKPLPESIPSTEGETSQSYNSPQREIQREKKEDPIVNEYFIDVEGSANATGQVRTSQLGVCKIS